ncbi:MAG TPA: Xaa-Pro peptidase family protein [Desulfatiglandales bacterium]|nr:Xaa-Pro peptidase family protein [Desulfatiglandales bacterium]
MSNGNLNLRKAVEALRQRGLDGLIIYSSGTCSILHASYLHYFSECKPLGPHNAALVSKAGDVALLVEPPWDALRNSRISWISEVRGSADFTKDLLAIMRQFKITGSVGLVGSREMTINIYSAVEHKASVVSADDIIEEIAREKTPDELENVKKTARIADLGFNAFLEHSRAGIREYELVAEMEYAMRRAGADDIFILISSGEHNYEMHEPTDRRLRKGDIVIGEITPICEGQFIQLCRTVVLGKPSPLLVEKYDMLLKAFHESLKTVRPGSPAGALSQAMNKVISDAGYAEYCYPPYMRARGHGFGVGSIAPGAVIDDDTKVDLQENQVIVVHPNQYLPETGYLACGETVLVTQDGMERLSETETRLYSKEV